MQPSPETRALYLQVVTAGDGLSLRRVEHHRDVVVDLAATVAELVQGEEPGGVIWLHGEPGAGRGAVAREAVRLLETVRSDAVDRVLILPEIIALDDLERQRLRREALAERMAFLVPVRQPVGATSSVYEASVTVSALDRTEFRELLTQLLQERPSRAARGATLVDDEGTGRPDDPHGGRARPPRPAAVGRVRSGLPPRRPRLRGHAIRGRLAPLGPEPRQPRGPTADGTRQARAPRQARVRALPRQRRADLVGLAVHDGRVRFHRMTALENKPLSPVGT